MTQSHITATCTAPEEARCIAAAIVREAISTVRPELLHVAEAWEHHAETLTEVEHRMECVED